MFQELKTSRSLTELVFNRPPFDCSYKPTSSWTKDNKISIGFIGNKFIDKAASLVTSALIKTGIKIFTLGL